MQAPLSARELNPGYARQHQDKELSTGLSLVWEVERVLQVRGLRGMVWDGVGWCGMG